MPRGLEGEGIIGNSCVGTPVRLPVTVIPESLKMNARFAVPMTGKTK
jgi:hypothetical protein